MNMYLHELKSYRKSTTIWSLTLIVIVVLFLSLFPSFLRDVEEFKGVLEGFPIEMRKAIGLSVDSFATLIGFYSYSFLYLKLCGAIQAMNLGVSIVSKETREKTADFLLTKPVTRTQIITSKLLAALTSLFITNVFFISATLIMASIVATVDYSVKVLFMIGISLFFIQLIFLALGVIVSVVFTKIKSVISVSLGSVFAFFMIAMIGSSTEDTALRYITPFNYFNSSYIVEHSSYEGLFIITGALIILICIITSYIVYRKKDVHTV